MIYQIVDLLVSAFTSVSNWFGLVFDRTGTTGLYLGAIVIVLCVRLLLAPLLGAAISSGASDKVKHFKKQDKGDK